MRKPYLQVDRDEGVWGVTPVPGGGCVRERLGTLAELAANSSLIPPQFLDADLTGEQAGTLHRVAVLQFNAGHRETAGAVAQAAMNRLRRFPWQRKQLPEGRESIAVITEIRRQGGVG